MNDRASEEYAQSVFESLYEDSKTLKACAKLLADSIRFAHQMGEACWSLTLFPNQVRLNAGPVEVLVCRVDKIFMILLGSQNLTLKPEINQFIKGPEIFYSSVPVSQYKCELPAKLVDNLYPIIAEEHQAFIQFAAKRRKKSAWRKSFSIGMILYLNKLFGISLPTPSYFSSNSEKKKISNELGSNVPEVEAYRDSVGDSSIDDIKRIINALLPEKEKRLLCLKLLAESINHANSCGNDKWGSYYKANRVRLLVGNLIVFTIEKGGTWLALDRDLIETSGNADRLVEANGWQWDEDDYPTYSQVPSRNGYYTPSESHLEIWPVIRRLHFDFISNVAAKYKKLKKTSQAKHSPVVIRYLSKELGKFVPVPVYEQIEVEDNFVLPEEIADNTSFCEGGKQRITVNAYERNPKARKKCIAYFGTQCQVCEFDFSEKYGEVGIGVIQVHHLKPLSHIGKGYEIDPIQDLVPVCPNCHAIIHRRNPPYTIEEVKRFLR